MRRHLSIKCELDERYQRVNHNECIAERQSSQSSVKSMRVVHETLSFEAEPSKEPPSLKFGASELPVVSSEREEEWNRVLTEESRFKFEKQLGCVGFYSRLTDEKKKRVRVMFEKEQVEEFSLIDERFGLDLSQIDDLLHALNSLSVSGKRKMIQSLFAKKPKIKDGKLLAS